MSKAEANSDLTSAAGKQSGASPAVRCSDAPVLESPKISGVGAPVLDSPNTNRVNRGFELVDHIEHTRPRTRSMSVASNVPAYSRSSVGDLPTISPSRYAVRGGKSIIPPRLKPKGTS
jgi:hypothetical protein